MKHEFTEQEVARLLDRCSTDKQRRIAKLSADVKFLQSLATTNRSLGNHDMHATLVGVIRDHMTEITHILLYDPGVPAIPPMPPGCRMVPHQGRIS